MYERSSGAYRHKNEKLVRLHIAGADPVTAHIFHVNGERLTDLLNDPREFIPVRKEDGDVMIVAKSQIVSIIDFAVEDIGDSGGDDDDDTGLNDKANPSAKSFDAYAMLRVAPDATVAEIRAAYKARIKAVHPDTIASLGLDQDLAKAALHSTQKINYAYKKIMSERTAA